MQANITFCHLGKIHSPDSSYRLFKGVLMLREGLLKYDVLCEGDFVEQIRTVELSPYHTLK